MKRRLGIVAFFTALSAAFLFMSIIVIGTMIYGVSAQRNLQLEFMNRAAQCDAILSDLYELGQSFHALSYDWSVSSHETYQNVSRKLDGDLEKVKESSQDNQSTLDYVRRIGNFNFYQRNLVRKILDEPSGYYEVYSYIMTSLDMHQQEAVEMAQGDMISSRIRYEEKSHKLTQQMFAAAGFLLMISFVMGTLLVRFSIITKKVIDSMTEYFNCLANRKWETEDLVNSQYHEFENICQTANHMKHEIRNYIREIKNQVKLEKQLTEEKLKNEQQQAMLVTAQMSALRAQVNPHFLFNSLNLIGVTALVGDSKLVMQMVEATGRILRYSLYHEDLMTNLEEELEVVRQYLFIQKCRFKEAVHVQIHNDLEEEEILIPTMSIQPIVENCFKHGFQKKDYLNIRIVITWEDDKASISVTDNGVGFNPQKVLERGKGGIGLNNIRKRLELIYGVGNAIMEIESEQDEFSCVTLLIPQKGEKNESTDC